MDWLPTSGLRRPVPCTRPDPPQWVSELIDQTIASWDRGKLLEFFTPANVEAITSIPLSTRCQEDFWAWHFEKRGFFSVRSAYRMLINRKFLVGNAGTLDRQVAKKEWSTLWGIRVPSKVCVFLWRLARCSLPSTHHRNMAEIALARYVERRTRGDTHYLSATWHAVFGLWRKRRLLSTFINLRNKMRRVGWQ